MSWLERLFSPPDIPIDLPLAARIPAVKRTIVDAFKLAYVSGVWDGFVAGALLTTVIFLIATRRRGDRT